MKRVCWLIALVTFAVPFIRAQDISGDWQGTLKAGGRELRTILQIKKGDTSDWKALLLSIDQSPDRGAGVEATSFSLEGNHVNKTISVV